MEAMTEAKTEAPTRDLAVDYYRVSGVVLIVLGHWLLSCITFTDGSFGLQDPLADIAWTRWLTWPLQAVPVFFLAAGYASAASWQHRCAGAGMSRQAWVRNRLSRALGPTGAYLAFVSALIVIATLCGAPGRVLEYAGWAVAMQLWFLAVYVIVVYLTPIALAAHRHWGLLVPAALGLGVIAVDVASIGAHVPYLGWLNYLCCWGALYQLGIAWQAGMLDGRRAVVLAGASAIALGLLIGVGPFPVSMISVTGQTVQNSSPPSVALLAWGCLETGLAVALGPALNRALQGQRVRQVLSVANTNVMALYLWHMVPVVVVAAVLYPAGLLPQPTENSLPWWGVRLLWLLTLTVVAAAEMVVLHRLRGIFAAPLPMIRVPAGPVPTAVAMFVGVVLTAYGIAFVSARGFAPSGLFPWHAMLVFAAGAVLVALTPASRPVAVQPGSGG